eukprot:Nitzschia sp. Nitz4//scaffold141_size107518//85466//87034//NITZ4_004293-RA/size107518-processed-gene-0.117-mRNA-1//1//CDS//3329536339//3110//frame0
MVRAVASRVVPKARISKSMAREAAAEAARIQELARNADAPASVARIPARAGDDFRTARVGLRPMGTSRRVFLLDPHLGAAEMDGLAHRIRALADNNSINSILIATDDKDDAEMNCLPRYVTALDDPAFRGLTVEFDPSPDSTWHVSGGYDPLVVAQGLDAPDAKENERYMLESLKKLALAVKGVQGGEHATYVPVVTMPHGIVTDGGFAFCMGGYVMATRQSSFKIMNPSRGLSLDPVGLSYILPRLGWEHQQRSSKYSGCGMLMALAGYEANCFDMVETGLATHLVADTDALPLLEHSLATMRPWNQQKLVKNNKRFYGKKHFRDPNSFYRNVEIANVIEQLSEHAANPSNTLPYDYMANNMEDPALDTEVVPWDSGFYTSDLVDTAAHFDSIFKRESTVEGILERLREAGSKKSEDAEEKENIAIAKELVQRMERQSPLALRVTYQLLKMGRMRNAQLESCMDREVKAQLNMFQQKDFQEWARHVQAKGGESKAPAFTGWKHKSVKDVTDDEVDAIISGN